MKKILLFLTGLFLAVSAMTYAAVPEGAHRWMHVYHKNRQFHSYKMSDIERIGYNSPDSEESVPDSIYVFRQDGDMEALEIASIKHCKVGCNIPTIYIDLIDHPDWDNLRTKEDYQRATIRIDGNGLEDDLEETEVQIKGRGNSTWTYPKKPYRLKFDKKQKICGMKKAKSFALIANFIDETLLCNAVADKIAEQIELPYSPSWHPVRLYFNGRLQGSYFITEKLGINSGSVDIDEETGVLFEMDIYFDEQYKFRDATYHLPVQIKDPDLEELAEKRGTTAQDLRNEWKAVFDSITNVIHTRSWDDISDVVDLEDAAKFLLVNLVAQNQELTYPKSAYAYMTSANDKLHFGPVWDFDWAFGFYHLPRDWDRFLFPYVFDDDDERNGCLLFRDIARNPEFMRVFGEIWEDFYRNKFPELLDFLDEAAALIEPSAKENGLLWRTILGMSSYDSERHVQTLRQWLINRVKWISSQENFGLFETKKVHDDDTMEPVFPDKNVYPVYPEDQQ